MKGVAACKRARVEEGLPGTPPSEELDLEDADPNDLVGRFVNITGAPSSQAEDLLCSQEWDLERALRVYIRDQPSDISANHAGGGSRIPGIQISAASQFSNEPDRDDKSELIDDQCGRRNRELELQWATLAFRYLRSQRRFQLEIERLLSALPQPLG